MCIAMLAYATVPAIRYTYLGLTRVPVATIEAAIASGTTSLATAAEGRAADCLSGDPARHQPDDHDGAGDGGHHRAHRVARPRARKSTRRLPGADTGRGLLAGLGIAFIGIIADRLIGAWAAQQKQKLGMA